MEKFFAYTLPFVLGFCLSAMVQIWLFGAPVLWLHSGTPGGSNAQWNNGGDVAANAKWRLLH